MALVVPQILLQEKLKLIIRKEQTEINFEGWTDNQEVKTSYEYLSEGVNTSNHTSRISTRYNQADGKIGSITWDYTYENGNIICEDGQTDMLYNQIYNYDEIGQLTWAGGWIYDEAMCYDEGGNIVIKELWADNYDIYEYLEFEYGDANWPDKLTSVNDIPITYDAIGNPLSYNGTTYTWSSGRQLTTMSSFEKTLSFNYNELGLRTHKIVNENETTKSYIYSWNEYGKLVSQSDGTTTLYFIYDVNDEVIGFVKLNDSSSETYYYLKNLQGDVCAIIDSFGNPIVKYIYDAWGYLIGINGSQAESLGALNPIRYRSYCYDNETGYYYLHSRYYDPLWGRFINADTYTHTGESVLGGNMFAYAENNPVNMIDSEGTKSYHFFTSSAPTKKAAVSKAKELYEKYYCEHIFFRNIYKKKCYKFMCDGCSVCSEYLKTLTYKNTEEGNTYKKTYYYYSLVLQYDGIYAGSKSVASTLNKRSLPTFYIMTVNNWNLYILERSESYIGKGYDFIINLLGFMTGLRYYEVEDIIEYLISNYGKPEYELALNILQILPDVIQLAKKYFNDELKYINNIIKNKRGDLYVMIFMKDIKQEKRNSSYVKTNVIYPY